MAGRPLQDFGWAVITCIFGWFATVFFKGLCNIILTVSYLQSYFKLRKMLSNKPEPKKNSFHLLYLFLIGTSFSLSLSLGGICLGEYQKAWKNRESAIFETYEGYFYASQAVYQVYIILQLGVALVFSGTGIGVWRMLSTEKYLQKNRTSLMIKQLLCMLNFVSDIIVFFKFTKLMEGIFLKADKSSPQEQTMELISFATWNLVKQAIEGVSLFVTSGYLWYLTMLEAAQYK